VAQPCRGKVERRLAIRERADNTGAPSDLAQDAFQRVIRADAAPVFRPEGVVGQRLMDPCFHNLGRFGQAQAAQLLERGYLQGPCVSLSFDDGDISIADHVVPFLRGDIFHQHRLS
jgi:hypothetical protein